jgi:SET domain
MQQVSPTQRGLISPTITFNVTSQPRTTQSPKRIALYSTRATSPSNPAATDSISSSKQEAKTTQEYFSWASTAGIIFPKVTQAFFGEIRGSKALQPIEPAELFVTVPRTAALVIEPTGKCPITDFVSAEYWKQAPWYFKMAALLLKEASMGKNSPVWGYIVQLPETIDTPVRWTDPEISELQYSPLENDIKQQRKLWKEQYELFKKGAKGLGGAHVTYDKFLWAAENVRSRAFSGPYAGAPIGDRLKLGGFVAAAGLAYVTYAHVPLEQALNGAIAAAAFNLLYDIVLSSKLKWYALCPVIDAINHSSKVESTIEYEYFKDTFVASTNTAYKPGEQVFISYGAQPNSALFQYYGFTEVGNTNDVYAVYNAEIGKENKNVNLVVAANGNLTPDSLKNALEVFNGSRGGGGDKNVAELRKEILSILETELASKPTSSADDERQLATPHLLTPRKRAALVFRVEKKRLLERAIGRARKKAAPSKK